MKIFASLFLLFCLIVGIAHAAQTYATLPNTTPPGLTGTALVNDVNANEASLLTNNIGTSAPAYIGTGSIWIDSTNHLMKLYDGSTSLSIGNYASSTWSPLGAASGLTGIGTASLGGITGSPSNTTYLRGDGTWSSPSGSGTITSSTSTQIPVYTAATTVAGGANFTISTGALTLGVSGTAGSIKMGNATSGTITLQPVTGALGTVTVSIPAATDTLVNLTGTQTLTNKTLTSPTLTTPALGTPASGVLTNTTGIGTSNMTAVTGSANSTNFLRGDNQWATPAGGGTVTTTGSPANGNLAKFSGATSVTSTDLTGDVTTSGTLASTVAKIAGTTVSGTTGTTNVVFSASPTVTGTVTGANSNWSGNVGIGTATPLSELSVFGGAMVSNPSTLAISTATFTPVAVAANTYRVVLIHASCPCTIANPSGTAVDGQRFLLEIWQSATGSDTVSFGGNYDFGTAGSPTLTTTASKGDLLGFSYSAQNSKYNYIGIQQGM